MIDNTRDYGRVFPKQRSGTSGITFDEDVLAGNGVFLVLPERIAMIAVACHIPEGETARFVVETSCSSVDKIGDSGTGGYWDNIFGEGQVMTENIVTNIANGITAIRVRVIEASALVNVCFVG